MSIWYSAVVATVVVVVAIVAVVFGVVLKGKLAFAFEFEPLMFFCKNV